MDELTAALEALADEDLHARTGPQLLGDIPDLVAARNRLDAELARRLRVADSKQAFAADGMATAQSWLRGHCRLSGDAAARMVRNGRTTEWLPAVADAHAAGKITADQVSVIGKITGPRPVALAAAQGIDLTEVSAVLARFAATQPHDDLVRLVHQVLARLDQDGPEPDSTEERFLSVAKHADGSGTGRFHLTRSAWRSCRPRWSRSCRRTAPRVTPVPGPSSRPTPWSSWPTSIWAATPCPCCAG